ncbi:MAG: polysaccharide pyruvyl transferase family protein [Candidatus Omnitrophica bacterium]|nr:polysaccharide pyruvyl transferase family protein [Candidatus Omnitrophota bacterium]
MREAVLHTSWGSWGLYLPKASTLREKFNQIILVLGMRLAMIGIRFGRGLSKPKLSCLLLPPASPGSLGDEAMLLGAIEQLKVLGVEEIGVLSYMESESWERKVKDPVVKHGYLGNILSSMEALKSFLCAVKTYQYFCCLGADVMDGHYGEQDTLQRFNFLRLADRMGVKTRLLNLSFNEHPALSSVRALRGLPKSIRISARDPLSLMRLEEKGNRPVAQAADLAFLLAPGEKSDQVREILRWIDEKRKQGFWVIGINANTQHLQVTQDLSLPQYVECFLDALEKLHREVVNTVFVLIPHDERGEMNDETILKAIFDKSSPEVRAHTLKVSFPLTACEIRDICAQLDFLLASRMHLAIAALSQAVPAAGISYQGKFEGLFQLFGMDSMCLRVSDIITPGVLPDFLKLRIIENKDWKDRIERKLGEIRGLARNNFEGMGKAVLTR